MAQQKLNKNTATRQAARIQLVLEERARRHASRIGARKQQAFLAAVQEAAAQYGVDPKQLLRTQAANARANSATVAPSREAIVVNGESLRPCKAVHALCATIPDASRKEMMQLCIDNGVNRATAATQVGKFRKDASMSEE
jgi:D-alanyl-D-alanine dipeptidase